MIKSIIVAQSENGCIGINNTLPWYLPADLKRFKSITMGHCIIMGRKTLESIGKALPGRTSIVITRNTSFTFPDCIVVHSIEEAFIKAEELNETEAFIIGGADLIRQSIDTCDQLYLTIIHHPFEGDTFLKPLSNDWTLMYKEAYQPDEKNAYSYSFLEYKKN
ncbi:MAG: dihydrofolate reductase [Cytophagaceae bacterium]|jgi:dihydrofolate reductase|nr:dihydrofolate reductase [Cytophagaceae bacterium]